MAAKKRQPHSKSRVRPDDEAASADKAHLKAENDRTAQVRAILLFVCAFTIAFVGVVGLRLVKERDHLRAEAELSFARTADFLSEKVSARLEAIDAAVASGAALLADESGDIDLAAWLSAINASAGAEETLFIIDGGQAIIPEQAAGRLEALSGAAESAMMTPSGRASLLIGGSRKVVIARALTVDGVGQGVLVSTIDPSMLLPEPNSGRVLALAGQDGAILSTRPRSTARTIASATDLFGLSQSELQRALERAGTGAVVFGRSDLNDSRMAVGVSAVQRSDLVAYVAGRPRINQALWRDQLIWYSLMAAAPVIIALGLSGVLLYQVSSIRSARRALEDSEVRFRLAIEGARCGVWDWDTSTDTVFMTESLSRMLGHSGSSRLAGHDFLSLVRPEDRDLLRAAIRGAVAAQEVDVEFRAANLPVWLHARGRPWTGGGESSSRIVGVAIDVTEQKGAQARVAAAEGRLRAAMESMSESFVLWDARDRLVLWNRKFQDFFKLPVHVLKPGASYADIETAASPAIDQSLDSDSGGDIQEMLLTDGRWLHYSERRTRDGGLVSIGTDITSIKRQEAKLKESQTELRRNYDAIQRSQERIKDLARKYEQEKIRAEEGNRSKSEFLANMSHELRTPLNAINGFSEIMRNEMFGPLGDDRYKEYVSDILSSGQHLLALINDILDMSKIEAGKMKLQPELIYPDEVVETCARLMRARAQDAGLELKMELGALPQIEADPRALKQVILNLLSNAIKFTPEGGHVSVSAHPADNGVEILVSDTGIGISEDDLPRLARPFEQIESQHSKSHQGSGLGLALSKSLVEMHGGTLSIQSQAGQGTTVTVIIPFEPHQPETQRSDEELERAFDEAEMDAALEAEEAGATKSESQPERRAQAETSSARLLEDSLDDDPNLAPQDSKDLEGAKDRSARTG